MQRSILLLCFSFLFSFIFSQTGEVRIKFKTSKISIAELTRSMSIENVKNDSVYANLNNEQFQQFLKLGIKYEILSPALLHRNARKSANQEYTFDYYPMYNEYVDFLESLEFKYPALCKVFKFGKSVNNKDLYFIRINKDTLVPKPSVMYSSTMHGDETGGFVLMLRLADYLLSGYNSDPLLTQLVDKLDIWINPLANPDGAYGNNNEIGLAVRRNANGVDLNRSFPDPYTGEMHFELQPETKAMMDVFEKNHFVLSANFHSGAEVVNYPWDSYAHLHADNSWFVKVAQMYADTAKKYGRSNYFTSVTPSGIVNGYEWYPIFGGRQDYITYWHQGREFTIELDDNYITPETELNNLWLYNYRSLLNLLNEATYGINGIIKDSINGQYIKAKIEIVGHDDDNSYVYSDSSNGHFFRLVEQGSYEIKVSADGYFSKTIYINLNNREQSELIVLLQKNGKSFINPGKGTLSAKLYPNPTHDFLQMPLEVNEKIEVVDIFGKRVLSIVTKSNTLDVRSLKKGFYIIKAENGWIQAFVKE